MFKGVCWIKSKIRGQAGMTMLEILISFAVLALVSLTAIKLSINSQQLTQDTQLKLLATGAGRSVMELVRSTPLTDVPSIITTPYIPADLPGATIALTTSPGNLAGVDIATITIRVSWTGSQGRPRTMDLTTLKTRYGRVE